MQSLLLVLSLSFPFSSLSLSLLFLFTFLCKICEVMPAPHNLKENALVSSFVHTQRLSNVFDSANQSSAQSTPNGRRLAAPASASRNSDSATSDRHHKNPHTWGGVGGVPGVPNITRAQGSLWAPTLRKGSGSWFSSALASLAGRDKLPDLAAKWRGEGHRFPLPRRTASCSKLSGKFLCHYVAQKFSLKHAKKHAICSNLQVTRRETPSTAQALPPGQVQAV